ncbi:deoxyribonuclease IV [Methanoplanus endosymbiosus]|uniref:Probable endonuclease 4 n=1 Tax=Methanoplanus endosymbiosus TaxID=33865 RepID=A0A9E7PQ72_9EURY|nr:deoxyribonuclease IV [Methanoplanus endosymbiosus]UUX91537.1 deoxyribonuclease IV [Methanoplanus endosymbiosus]
MINVGCHVSIAKSIDLAVGRAAERGCTTFQIFTSNPRGWKAREIKEEEAEKFIKNIKESGIYPPIAHMPYLPNPASPREEVQQKSTEVMLREVKRCRMLKIPYLVTHPGSHLGAGREDAIKRFTECIDLASEESEGEVMLLLENTAGTNNSMGGDIEDIAEIIDNLSDSSGVGICIDTCHAFAAGYDITTEEGLSSFLELTDSEVGPERLKVIHLNDCKGALGSHLDRHEHIGLGNIGDEAISRIVNHPKLRDIPFILETPVNEERGDAENIAHVKSLFRE